MFFSIPWYIQKSETIKLKSCRNLIEHYLGDFLEKLTLEQLCVNLYNGTGTVSNVTLDCDALNKLGDDRNFPFQVVKGHMQGISVTVPWSNVFKYDSVLKVDGLSLTLQPKIRTGPAKSFLKWLVVSWPKLTSKQIFMLNKNKDGFERYTEKEEKLFADNIEAILRRLKVKFENTKIRIEHLPQHVNRGFALDICIRSIYYCGEALSDFLPIGLDVEPSRTYVIDTCAKQKIKIEGVSLYTDDFYIKKPSIQHHRDNLPEPHRRTMDYNVNKHVSDCAYHETNDNDILGTEPNAVRDINLTQNLDSIENEQSNPLGPIMCAILNGQHEITLSSKILDKMDGLSIATKTIGPFVISLSQKQLDAVIDLLECFKETRPQETR